MIIDKMIKRTWVTFLNIYFMLSPLYVYSNEISYNIKVCLLKNIVNIFMIYS